MTRARLLIVVVLLIAAIGGIRLTAQRLPVPVEPQVITGPDIGFRIEGVDGNTPIGRLVVRVNGRWVDVELGGGKLRPAN
jgi:hypothetical protein